MVIFPSHPGAPGRVFLYLRAHGCVRLLFCCSAFPAVSQIYAAINTPTIHYDGSKTWHSSNPDSWTRANNPTSSTAKSIFDPCPYGYRVPTSNNTTTGTSDFFGFTTPPNGNGASWLGSWWPTSGARNYSSAIVGFNGIGYYWAASPVAYRLRFSSGYVTPIDSHDYSTGAAVRCVQE